MDQFYKPRAGHAELIWLGNQVRGGSSVIGWQIQSQFQIRAVKLLLALGVSHAWVHFWSLCYVICLLPSTCSAIMLCEPSCSCPSLSLWCLCVSRPGAKPFCHCRKYGPSERTAMQKQLGVKWVRARLSVSFLLVDVSHP